MKKYVMAFTFLAAAAVVACSPPNTQKNETPKNDEAQKSAAALSSAKINDGYVKPLLGGRDVTSAYGTISLAQKDVLESARSPNAQSIEIHTHSHENGMMVMRKVDKLASDDQGNITLSMGASHLMLFGFVPPTDPNAAVPITLHFQKAGDVTVQLPVRDGADSNANAASSADAAADAAMDEMMKDDGGH